MALAYKYERTLEEHFIVVNWDQRGAGKSYSKKIATESLNTEQYISDCVELVKILMNRFKKKKIYIMGHSWGSVLGTYVVQRHPEFFYAYIGIGQVANMIQNEQISYKFVYDRAKETNNDKALKKLEEIQPYDGKDFKKIKIQRKWLTKFKGSVYNFKSEWDMMKYGLGSPEYSLRDFIKFFKGSKFTIDAMLEQLTEVDFFTEVPELKVPIYICQGRHDYQTPFELAERFFNQVKAPKKKFIWFENSAHSPIFEESEKFNSVLINEVLKDTYPKK